MATCADCGWPITDGAVSTIFGPVHEKSCFLSWHPCLDCPDMLPARVPRCPACVVARDERLEREHRERMNAPAPERPVLEGSRAERWMAKGDALERQYEWEQKLDEDAQAYWRGELTERISPEESRER